MNVFYLDLSVALESSSIGEAGNLFRKQGAMPVYENAVSEKHRSDAIKINDNAYDF